MHIVLAGASGLIGSALRESLRADGYQVTSLVRRTASGTDVDSTGADSTDVHSTGVDSWDPGRGVLDPELLQGADAVVCLNGVGVGDRRWTEAYKREILASRVDPVATIARTLRDAPALQRGGPRVLIAASAIGYHGDGGDRILDETAPPGDTFLSGVCVEWEAAAEPARQAGVRVVHLRTGIVLARAGGLVKRLRPIVRAGLAGRLGNGRQYMSWISITDEVRAIRFLLEQELAGPVNLVAPAPVPNAEFIATLARTLHRPAVLPVPAFAIRLALGELAAEILGGQRAMPVRLLEAGFEFAHPDLASALAAELGPRGG